MTTVILEKDSSNLGTYFKVACGNTVALIAHYVDGRVNVCVQNASHRAFKRMGRYHANFEIALSSYKSNAVREMLFATKAEVAA